jgi:hypothetical protein
MPKKIIKLHTGQRIEIKAVRLDNGNLVIPARHEKDRSEPIWIEVTPGTSDYKRWLPVAVDEPDPRSDPLYQDRISKLEAGE